MRNYIALTPYVYCRAKEHKKLFPCALASALFFGIVCPTHAPDRRARVKAEADDLHREYVLSQIRQQVSFTQADVAETRL